MCTVRDYCAQSRFLKETHQNAKQWAINWKTRDLPFKKDSDSGLLGLLIARLDSVSTGVTIILWPLKTNQCLLATPPQRLCLKVDFKCEHFKSQKRNYSLKDSFIWRVFRDLTLSKYWVFQPSSYPFIHLLPPVGTQDMKTEKKIDFWSIAFVSSRITHLCL